MALAFFRRGGVKPLHRMHEGKMLTANAPIVEMPAPDRVYLSLSQGIGAPAKPVVAIGDQVMVGQLVAEAGGFVGSPVHSSISGTVQEITPMPSVTGAMVPHVIIANNDGADEGYDSFVARDVSGLTPGEMLDAIRGAGIVGMGGAGFPTHVKLSIPEGKVCEMLLINGAECEPFLTADQRLMEEEPQRILKGVSLAMKVLGVKRAIIGIEENKERAIGIMTESARNYEGITVQPMRTKYPQGAEKQLIQSLADREVPRGGLPVDCGVVVLNTGTCAAIHDILHYGKPVIQRVVTVTGAVGTPQNILARIGTSFQDAIAFSGGYTGEVAKLISGGPMMGFSVYTDSIPISKGTSGILVMDQVLAKETEEINCIRCGRCADACPIGLQPLFLDAYSRKENVERCEAYGAADCIECGCCSFVCPSQRYLVQSIRQGKAAVLAQRRREAEVARQ